MSYDDFNDFCRGFPASTYSLQWGGSHVWKVGAKVFAVGGWQKSGQIGFTFKASDNNYEILKDEPGYRPAPYLASRGLKWIQQCEVFESSEEQLKYYLAESHRIVSLGLSKKMQRGLGLNQD
jgi:predicted DNA-binding protein (MmcQ/YjbR family)